LPHGAVLGLDSRGCGYHAIEFNEVLETLADRTVGQKYTFFRAGSTLSTLSTLSTP
jgi:hypothetical protein